MAVANARHTNAISSSGTTLISFSWALILPPSMPGFSVPLVVLAPLVSLVVVECSLVSPLIVFLNYILRAKDWLCRDYLSLILFV